MYNVWNHNYSILSQYCTQYSAELCYADKRQQQTSWLVKWEINVPFQQNIGYIRDKVLDGDLILSL